MQTIEDLLNTIPQVGRLEWIGVSPQSRAAIQLLTSAVAILGKGLDADHHAKGRTSKRQVTLIQHEHLRAIASLSGLAEVAPEMLRRNLVVSGINLLALKDKRFWVGESC